MYGIRKSIKLTRNASSYFVRFLSIEKHFRYKGTVKFYLRDKGFGFIIPDGSDRGVFVHKISIAGADQVPDEVQLSTCRYPYLLEGERVTFEIINDPDRDGKEMAVQVRFLNDEIIPPERPDFLARVKEETIQVFGEKVFMIMENSLRNTVENQLNQIQEAYCEAQATIEKSEQLIEMLGMKPKDFLDLDAKRNLEENNKSSFRRDSRFIKLRYSIPTSKTPNGDKDKT